MMPILLSASDTPSIIDLYLQMHLVEKSIVWTLGIFSLIAWTIMLGKMAELKKLQELNRAFESRVAEQRSLLELPETFKVPEQIPFGALFKEALDGYWRGARVDQQAPTVVGKSKGIQLMENALQRGVARETLRYESSLVFLATIVSGAPFMGLLGTVWGVMNAFAAVSMADSVTLKMLAPGVAGALITTIAGLLVAIPAAFGYNYLLSTTRLLIAELESYASQLADRIEIEVRD
jgi:biopolymer transport protein TolQ